MRVVGGRLRGRALAAPQSQAIRPTADRLREALFNILAHAYGDPVSGARVLDLFAGTGALGIEAPRAAPHSRCSSTRRRRRARCCARTSRRSALAARRASSAATPPGSARRIRSNRSRSPFSIRLMARASPKKRSASARDGGWFAPDALIVVEEAAKANFAAPSGFGEIERRRYDETELIFLRAAAEG